MLPVHGWREHGAHDAVRNGLRSGLGNLRAIVAMTECGFGDIASSLTMAPCAGTAAVALARVRTIRQFSGHASWATEDHPPMNRFSIAGKAIGKSPVLDGSRWRNATAGARGAFVTGRAAFVAANGLAAHRALSSK